MPLGEHPQNTVLYNHVLLQEEGKLSFRREGDWGTWVAQVVKRLASAQVMISRFVSSSLVLGSVLTAQSLEPALDSDRKSVV